MSKNKKEKKEKKEKVIYYDDNSTIADMSSVNRKGEKREPPKPRIRSTAGEKWKTYWSSVKMMVLPMCIALVVLGILYLLTMWIGGNF